MKKLITIAAFIFAACSTFSQAESITYQVDGKPYEGYFVSPSESAPLIILLHDWDGLTDYEIKRSNMLKDKGYAVFAADLFGKGVRPTKDEDKKQHTGALYQDRKKLRQLVQAAVDNAKAQGGDINNAVVMGYCFGGAAVLEYARSGADMKGFVTFHGGLTTPPGQTYQETKGNVLVFHGSADTAITLNDLAKLGMELENNGVAHELISYGGAPHAFTVFDSERYREQADTLSWTRFLAYLERHLDK